MSESPKAEIGVFGGSGFYELLDNPKEFKVNTPYGAPSSAVMIGKSLVAPLRSCHGTAKTTRCHRTRSTIARTFGR